jgi:erythronate-4-phosphate dehydrogenase
MKIVADENIPCVERAFASLGEVTLLAGRGMQPAQVREADILLVRSVTRVDRRLLEVSRVRFVGSATIGFDHVDRDYLRERGIGFATAPGSNATSAAEYVVSALMVLAEQQGFTLAGRTAGIIGCGNVGSRVRQKLSALGIRCLVNDPPLKQQGGHDDFVGLDEVLQADIVPVHVPLTRDGPWPTHHLVDAGFLAQLGPGAIFINTSRGAVADNAALYRLLDTRPDLSIVLDVWEGEPAINTDLLGRVALGTPHIAGYSLDGKLRGTGMIYRAACECFDRTPRWEAAEELPAGPVLALAESQSRDVLSGTRAAVYCSYDIREDDTRLRALLSLAPAKRPAFFDRLRKEYPVRREFSQVSICADGMNTALAEQLQGLGFTLG